MVMVRESPETGNLSKMVAKLTGNRDLRFSDLATTAKISKIVGGCLEVPGDLLDDPTVPQSNPKATWTPTGLHSQGLGSF